MALNTSNSSNFEQLALKGLISVDLSCNIQTTFSLACCNILVVHNANLAMDQYSLRVDIVQRDRESKLCSVTRLI